MTLPETLAPIAPESLKIVCFPKSNTSKELVKFKILNIKHPKTPSKTLTILYGVDSDLGAQIYELNWLRFGNTLLLPKSKHSKETTEGDPIKSFVLSQSHQQDTDKSGIIISKPIIEVATKFNIVYLLLSHFLPLFKKFDSNTDGNCDDDNEDDDDRMRRSGIRFSTLEDTIDALENNSESILYSLIQEAKSDEASQSNNTESINQLFGFEKVLGSICESIEENDEQFYRISKSKTLKYLKSKVDKLSENFPKSIESHLILDKLSKPVSSLIVKIEKDSDSELDIPNEVLQSARIEYSIYLLGSYLDQYYVNLLLKEYDFTKMNSYLRELELEVEKQRIAQDNLNALNNNLMSQNAGSNGKRKLEPPKKSSAAAKKNKKPVVAVGKGALDSFFKKKQ